MEEEDPEEDPADEKMTLTEQDNLWELKTKGQNLGSEGVNLRPYYFLGGKGDVVECVGGCAHLKLLTSRGWAPQEISIILLVLLTYLLVSMQTQLIVMNLGNGIKVRKHFYHF